MQRGALEMMMAIVVKFEVGPKQGCLTPFWLLFSEVPWWPGRSRAEGFSHRGPQSAHGSPFLADTVPPGDFRPDRSRWQTRFTLHRMGQQAESPPFPVEQIGNQLCFFFFLGSTCFGEIPGLLGRKQSLASSFFFFFHYFLQKNILSHGSS